MKTNFKKYLRAFTLIEVVVVLGIIGILTAATIPTFNGITSTQNLKRSVDNLSSDIQLAKEKALAGSVQGTQTDVFWGMKCFAGTNRYQVGYAPNNAGVPGTFKFVEKKTLYGNATFIAGSCNTVVYFDRLTGELVSENSHSFKLEAGGEKTSVFVQKAGQVGSKKKFCGDGQLQSDEQCDATAPTSSSPLNITKDQCNPTYGETCTYCTSSCTTATVSGGNCGDGTIQSGNEDCDPAINSGVNVADCTPVYGGSCNYCDSTTCVVKTKTGDYCGDAKVQTNQNEQCDYAIKATGLTSYNKPESSCSPSYGQTCNYCTNSCKKASVSGGKCLDSVKQTAEACDPSAPVTATQPYNRYKSQCNPSYGQTCNYCTTSCTKASVSGGKCLDGVKQTAEACDPTVKATGLASYDKPKSSCNPSYGQTCNYCTNSCAKAIVSGGKCLDGKEQPAEQCDPSAPVTAIQRYNRYKSQCNPSYGQTCNYCTTSCKKGTVSGGKCLDGKKQTAEQCDPSAPIVLGQRYNRYKSQCNPSYGQTCNYCTTSCKKASISGGSCGDGVRQANEKCDPSIGSGYNVPNCTPRVNSSCQYCSSDCQSILTKNGPVSKCNYNGVCESWRGETVLTCYSDCKPKSTCNYNAICESWKGENFLNCSDCRGLKF